MLVGAWVLVDAWAGPGQPAEWFAAVLLLVYLGGAILMGRAVDRATRPLAIVLPASCIRDLVPALLVANVAKIRGPDPRGWSPPEVWEMILTIVADCAGVAPDQLNESTHFVNDLF